MPFTQWCQGVLPLASRVRRLTIPGNGRISSRRTRRGMGDRRQQPVVDFMEDDSGEPARATDPVRRMARMPLTLF